MSRLRRTLRVKPPRLGRCLTFVIRAAVSADGVAEVLDFGEDLRLDLLAGRKGMQVDRHLLERGEQTRASRPRD